MTKIRNIFLTATFLLVLGGLQAASAAMFDVTLGNDTPGFADPSIPPVTGVGSIAAAQTGQELPFNQSCGADVVPNPGDCSTSWKFSYGATSDPILSASLTIGIVDHDSAASGSQVGLFSLDGGSLTAALDNEFEAAGGLDGMYNVYSLSLSAGFFAGLADGIAMVMLALQGNGLQTCTSSFACSGETLPFVSETNFNGANLIFSTLTIETQDIPAVPLPAAAPLFLSALFIMGIYRRRVLRNEA